MVQPCKPNFVPDKNQAAIIYLARALLHRSSDLPGDLSDSVKPALNEQSEQPFFLPKQKQISLFDLASGVACLARPVTRNAVSSYLTFSPLPGRCRAVFFLWRYQYSAIRNPGCYPAPCSKKFGLSSLSISGQLPGPNHFIFL